MLAPKAQAKRSSCFFDKLRTYFISLEIKERFFDDATDATGAPPHVKLTRQHSLVSPYYGLVLCFIVSK